MDLESEIIALQMQIGATNRRIIFDPSESVRFVYELHGQELRARLKILEDRVQSQENLSTVTGSEVDVEASTSISISNTNVSDDLVAFNQHEENEEVHLVPVYAIEGEFGALRIQDRAQESLSYQVQESKESEKLASNGEQSGGLKDTAEHAVSIQQDNETTRDVSLAQTASEKSAEATCIACISNFAEEEVINCPCNHKYCIDCIVVHFTISVQGLSFPPACCGKVIPLETVSPYVDRDLLERYALKKAAIENPGAINCSLLSCQAVIPRENIINSRATCSCGTVTCIFCKFVAHDEKCNEEAERAAILKYAVDNALRNCHACGELHEKVWGCDHIVCGNCKAEFCYNCGQQWGTCSCLGMTNDARRLIHTGEVPDNRAAPTAAAPLAMLFPELPIIQAVANHQNCLAAEVPWNRLLRGHQNRCHICQFHTGRFLWSCSGCRILSCSRCLPPSERLRRFNDATPARPPVFAHDLPEFLAHPAFHAHPAFQGNPLFRQHPPAQPDPAFQPHLVGQPFPPAQPGWPHPGFPRPVPQPVPELVPDFDDEDGE